MIEITWQELKTYSVNNNISIQYSIVGNNYKLWIIDRTCLIPTDRDLCADTVDFEDNFKANGNKQIAIQANPFASKTLSNGKKLFKRYHGIQPSVAVGVNTIIYTIPYLQVKIVGLDIVGAELLDIVSLYILDSTTGTYSTIPNYMFNQFGFDVNVAKDFFRQENNYDADLYQGMQIKIIYNSQSVKRIGINFNLSEVK